MFTGLVEQTGQIQFLGEKSQEFVLAVKPQAAKSFKVKPSESVAVNGCCLTVTKVVRSQIFFNLNHETLAKTNFQKLKVKDRVNLERALKLSDRLGGHIVTGHIDCVAKLTSIMKKDYGWDIKVSLPADQKKYVIPKGSICLDGVSLTINEVMGGDNEIDVHITLIPETVKRTVFQFLRIGWIFNCEVDLIGKYIEQMVKP